MFRHRTPLWRWWRRFAGACGVLMGPHHGGVHRDVPIDVTGCVSHRLNLLQKAFPCAIGGPPSVTFIDGLPRSESFRQVTPLDPGPDPVQDPVDHLPVVPPPATTAVAHRQKRSQLFPFQITQVPPTRHIQGNESDDRPDTA